MSKPIHHLTKQDLVLNASYDLLLTGGTLVQRTIDKIEGDRVFVSGKCCVPGVTNWALGEFVRKAIATHQLRDWFGNVSYTGSEAGCHREAARLSLCEYEIGPIVASNEDTLIQTLTHERDTALDNSIKWEKAWKVAVTDATSLDAALKVSRKESQHKSSAINAHVERIDSLEQSLNQLRDCNARQVDLVSRGLNATSVYTNLATAAHSYWVSPSKGNADRLCAIFDAPVPKNALYEELLQLRAGHDKLIECNTRQADTIGRLEEQTKHDLTSVLALALQRDQLQDGITTREKALDRNQVTIHSLALHREQLSTQVQSLTTERDELKTKRATHLRSISEFQALVGRLRSERDTVLNQRATAEAQVKSLTAQQPADELLAEVAALKLGREALHTIINQKQTTIDGLKRAMSHHAAALLQYTH